MENFLSEFERNFTLAIGLSQDKLLLAYSFSWLLPPETHLLNLAVHPDFRGQGLGRRLLGSILRLSRKAQCRKVFLEVREGNQAAMGLYASLGFLPTSRRPSYYSDGSDAILMTLDF
jgi:ribosomal-protein-alanine N-acetyltransferase